MLTGNPFIALIAILLLYGVADRLFFGFLPDFLAPLKRNRRIKSLLAQIRLNPSDANGALELGVLHFEKRKYDKALEYLVKAKEKIENSARLYMYMGMAYMEKGDSGKGKEALDRALEINPSVGYGTPYIYLIQYCISRQIDDHNELAKLKECFEGFANAENFFKMGRVYKRIGNRQTAKDMFRHAIKEYSYCPGALKRLHRKWAFFSWINSLT